MLESRNVLQNGRLILYNEFHIVTIPDARFKIRVVLGQFLYVATSL